MPLIRVEVVRHLECVSEECWVREPRLRKSAMRLTLRTMLAYMDDILEPTDAEDIGHKIEESEFASDLVSRVRDVTRRLRLGAPKLFARGMGGDPNSVAEYLDNTLPGERVPEFERVCLESDMHLAEVASCHQILTLVLGEPVQVEPASRARMYRIAGKDHQIVIDGPEQLVAAASSTPEVAREPREKPEIPDYLREEKSWTRALVPWLAAMILVGGLVWVVWQAVGPLPLAMLDESLPNVAEPSPVLSDEVPDDVVVDRVESAPSEAVTVSDEAEPLSDVDSVLPEVEVPAAIEPREMIAREVESVDVAEPPLPSEESVGLSAPPTPEPLDLAVPEPDAPMDDEGEAVVEEDAPAPRVASRPRETALPLSEPDAAVSRQGMGRMLSNTDVVLRYQPTAEASWQQLPGGEMVFPGDRLLALPGFGSTLTLSQGVTVRMLSGTELELPESSGADAPALELLHGRMVLLTSGRADARVFVRTAQQSGELILLDAESTLAMEVSSRWAKGLSPEKEPVVPVVDLYVTRGRVAWQPASSEEEFVLAAPSYQRWDGGEILAVEPVESLPAWSSGVEDLSQIDQRAVAAMKVHLQPDRPIELTLRELASNRRPEVVSLAVRCLAYAGNYAPLIDTLNDPSQRGSWDEHLRVMTELGARNDRAAADLMAAFQVRRPEGAADLNRMLWGYTDEQLQGGAARQLVDFLDHDHLDYRVLAFWNLSRITGFTLYYRPEYPAPRREQYVQKWRQKLDAGLVVPKNDAQ